MNTAMKAIVELGLKGDERAVLLYVSDTCDVSDAAWLIPDEVSKATGISDYRNRENPGRPTDVERVVARLVARGVLVEAARTVRREGLVDILYRAQMPEPVARQVFVSHACPTCGGEVVRPESAFGESIECGDCFESFTLDSTTVVLRREHPVPSL